MTGGNNAGVMKIVGEAVRDYGLTAQGRVIAIGIAPWGCVQNKESLIDVSVVELNPSVPCCRSSVSGAWPPS